MKSFVTMLILILFSSAIFGQGAFLERGQSGLGVGVGFSTNKSSTGFGGSLNYSISGIFDLGISVSQSNSDHDLSVTVVSPTISYYPLKQNEYAPFTIAFSLGYGSEKFSSDSFDDDMKMSGEFFFIGATVHRTLIDALSTTKIQPMIGVTYVTNTTKIEDEWGAEKIGNGNLGLSLGVAWLFTISSKSILVMTPHIGFSEGPTSFGVDVAFIFKTKQ